MSLPTSGRNPLIAGRAWRRASPGATGGTNFVSNGVRNSAYEVMLDGGAVSGIEQNGGITEVKFNATVDVVEEFKVQTNYFSAEFGNSGGTIINMVSKSGTNQFHGVGYYFRSDNAMNANNWFSNSRGGTLVDSHKNNYGGTLGGPVYLPGFTTARTARSFSATTIASRACRQPRPRAACPRRSSWRATFPIRGLTNGNLVPIFDPSSTFVDASGNTHAQSYPGQHHSGGKAEQDRTGLRQVLPGAQPAGRPVYASQQLVCAGQHAQRLQQGWTPRSTTTSRRSNASARATA